MWNVAFYRVSQNLCSLVQQPVLHCVEGNESFQVAYVTSSRLPVRVDSNTFTVTSTPT
jgi:hypothetical protein